MDPETFLSFFNKKWVFFWYSGDLEVGALLNAVVVFVILVIMSVGSGHIEPQQGLLKRKT